MLSMNVDKPNGYKIYEQLNNYKTICYQFSDYTLIRVYSGAKFIIDINEYDDKIIIPWDVGTVDYFEKNGDLMYYIDHFSLSGLTKCNYNKKDGRFYYSEI